MNESRYEEHARLMKAIAHPTRLHLLELIRDNSPCVRSMEEALDIAQPTVSQHLSILRNLDIVESERNGHKVCYKIKNKTVLKLLDTIK